MPFSGCWARWSSPGPAAGQTAPHADENFIALFSSQVALKFFASEFLKFAEHISSSLSKYADTGKLPSGGNFPGSKEDGKKRKRKGEKARVQGRLSSRPK